VGDSRVLSALTDFTREFTSTSNPQVIGFDLE